MIPGLIPGQIHLLHSAVPVPADRRHRAIELIDGAALGITHINLAADETPLDAIALAQVAFLEIEHVDMASRRFLRIPTDRASALIDKPNDLPSVAIPSQPGDAVIGAACHAKLRDVAFEAHDLPGRIETRHVLLDIGETDRRENRQTALFGGQAPFASESFADLAVDDEPRGVVENEDVRTCARAGLETDPAFHDLLGHLLAVLRRVDAVEFRECLRKVSRARLRDCGLDGSGFLTHRFRQFDRRQSKPAHQPERLALFDGARLLFVAQKEQPCAGRPADLEEPARLPVAELPGFIKHEHVAIGDAMPPAGDEARYGMR